MKKFGLVLSGGGAKGYAHIGVLKALEENGITPDFIVGTSMGAIVGGLYAFKPDAHWLESWAYKFHTRKFIDVDPFLAFRDSLLMGKKVDKIFQNIFHDTDCTQTDIKFMAIASSLDTGKYYVLDKGPLWQAVRASMSMPIVFPPVKINGIEMCDGGVANNLADDVARKVDKNAVIVSIDVIGKYKPETSKLSYLADSFNMVNLFHSRCTALSPRYDDLRITTNTCGLSSLGYNKENATIAITAGYKAMKRNINKLKKLLLDAPNNFDCTGEK